MLRFHVADMNYLASKRRKPQNERKTSWFDWFVTGSFWLIGLAMAIGIIVMALKGFFGSDGPRLFFVG